MDVHNIFINRVLKMLGYFISNVAGLEDFQTFSACKAYFGPDKYNERGNNRDVIKLKWSIVNKHHKVCTNNVIVERF